MSPFEQTGTSEDWVKMPKVGQSYDFSPHGEITSIEKSTAGKFHFMKKITLDTPEGGTASAMEDLGYCYIVLFADGKKMSVSNWSQFYALDNAGVKEGCLMKINHPAKGEWTVEVL